MYAAASKSTIQIAQSVFVMLAAGVEVLLSDEPYSVFFLVSIAAASCLFAGIVSTLRSDRVDLFEMTKVGLHTAILGSCLVGINNQFIPQQPGPQLTLVFSSVIVSLGGMWAVQKILRKFFGIDDGNSSDGNAQGL